MSSTNLTWIVIPVSNSLPGWTVQTVIEAVRALEAEIALGTDVGRIERIRLEVLSGPVGLAADGVGATVVICVLCDLAIQGWRVTVKDGRILIGSSEVLEETPEAEKNRIRGGHLVGRDRQLLQEPVRRFIREMETPQLWDDRWSSVYSLMRDGTELAAALRSASLSISPDTFRATIDPYLQIVTPDARCSFTGRRLADIWKYFRHTWSTEYQGLLGRRMFVLVRDRAAENHPVIGIAALTSSVVQLKDRDEWIGWTSGQFFDVIVRDPSRDKAKWLLSVVKQALTDIYIEDFLEEDILLPQELSEPTAQTIDRLKAEVLRCRKAHERYPDQGAHKSTTSNPLTANWELQARSFLFRSKRASALSKLLEIRLILRRHGLIRPSKKALKSLLTSPDGVKVLALIARYAKSRHVGIDMLDITICGALPPYTHLLGGKLVALLMASPEIVEAYRRKYRTAPSLIASAMKGAIVKRQPRLVLLTTTSLYGTNSSQYNRLRVPAMALGDIQNGEIQVAKIGRSIGFGSYHLSPVTLRQMSVLVSQRREGRRVNSIFGEGVNPKFRKLREALDAAGLPSDLILRHGSLRLVYGLSLASNFREILMDRATRPQYLLTPKKPVMGTDALSEFWRTRWLPKRVARPGVLEAVESHLLMQPVSHGARVKIASDEVGLPLFEGESVEEQYDTALS